MHARRLQHHVSPAVRWWAVRIAAAAALFLAPVAGHAQSVDFDPVALSKQRTALYLRAVRASLSDLESEVNHLAVLSETCRVQYGAKVCGLADKPLGSAKLEERYAYYVRRPTEAHLSDQGVKIDRRNWGRPDAPAGPMNAEVRSQ
jgi:hypothetical protein